MLLWRNPENGRYYAAILGRDPFDGLPLLYLYKGGQIVDHPAEVERPASFLTRLRELRKLRRQHGYILTFSPHQSKLTDTPPP
ncbi:hypothetical protein [Chitinilyticum litopenaei]|uniref:hypothetical protein n=1 Tax=Chitinilyticum litopenaei TaxID=1121276 RepID=UPI00041AFE76|nr:hypothetical protein [Chitinilyticum litopenaei]